MISNDTALGNKRPYENISTKNDDIIVKQNQGSLAVAPEKSSFEQLLNLVRDIQQSDYANETGEMLHVIQNAADCVKKMFRSMDKNEKKEIVQGFIQLIKFNIQDAKITAQTLDAFIEIARIESLRAIIEKEEINEIVEILKNLNSDIPGIVKTLNLLVELGKDRIIKKKFNFDHILYVIRIIETHKSEDTIVERALEFLSYISEDEVGYILFTEKYLDLIFEILDDHKNKKRTIIQNGLCLTSFLSGSVKFRKLMADKLKWIDFCVEIIQMEEYQYKVPVTNSLILLLNIAEYKMENINHVISRKGKSKVMPYYALGIAFLIDILSKFRKCVQIIVLCLSLINLVVGFQEQLKLELFNNIQTIITTIYENENEEIYKLGTDLLRKIGLSLCKDFNKMKYFLSNNKEI